MGGWIVGLGARPCHDVVHVPECIKPSNKGSINLLLINVKVKPHALKNEVRQLGVDSYEVRTTAAPEKDKANQQVIRLLAEFLGVSPSALTIIRGETSGEKLILLQKP